MITGILFDKDGTLFDFQATWSTWTRALLNDLSEGDAARAAALGAAVGFDMEAGRFSPDSPIITHTPDEIATALLTLLPGKSMVALVSHMNAMSATVALTPAVALVPFLDGLRDRGLRLGVATNDAESAARAQLASAGIERRFDFIAGFDSGHGGKPAPGMLLAFAQAFDLVPEQVLMVGDSRHDLIAGRAAGMRPVGVLTGLASAADLAPLAEAVLPDIGHLPAWIDAQMVAEI
ncbi:MAG: HAD-IA family hydrolase [Rhodobacteraceae bacterium]|nr:HAD-IA family hydrolase [Paracoccaceae bacterium]